MRNLLTFAVVAAAITPVGCSSNDSAVQGAGASNSGGAAAGSVASAAGTTAGGTAPGGANAGGGAGSTAGAGPSGGVPGTSAGSGGTGPLPTSTLPERLGVKDIEVSAGVKEGVSNWRIWDRGDLNVAPVFTVPLPSCETLICFTSGTQQSPVAHIVKLGADDTLTGELVSESGVECRGLAAGEAGQLAALLWNGGAETIQVKRYDAAGMSLGSTPLSNADNNPTDFEIGESRLEFGGGKYGAYYHVHSDSGHEGDTLKWVDAASGAEDTEWSWGCSHSMCNLLRYNASLK